MTSSNKNIITINAHCISLGSAQAEAMGRPERIRCFIDDKGRGIITGTKKLSGNKVFYKSKLSTSCQFSATNIIRHWNLFNGHRTCRMVGKRIILDDIVPRKGSHPPMRGNSRNDGESAGEKYNFEGWPF